MMRVSGTAMAYVVLLSYIIIISTGWQ